MASNGDTLVPVYLLVTISQEEISTSIFFLFGSYTDMHADYTGQGLGQLADVIDKIKSRPDDRHIIISAVNPPDLKSMALSPCHMFAQVCDILLLIVLSLFASACRCHVLVHVLIIIP